jgi:hypothetical protein
MPSLTYAELAAALKITPESANRLARRKRWARVKGNDGRTRVSVPEEALVRPDSPQDSLLDRPPVSPGDVPMDNGPVIKALEAHVATLREQLAGAETREAGLAGELSAERERTNAALAAFSALADRLDALAEARSRPWWRRLVG